MTVDVSTSLLKNSYVNKNRFIYLIMYNINKYVFKTNTEFIVLVHFLFNERIKE